MILNSDLDGGIGRGAIWTGEGREPFIDPYGYIDRVKWHSALNYLRIIDAKQFTVNLPAIPASGSGQGSGGRRGLRTNLYTLGPHGRPGQPFIIGVTDVAGVPCVFTGSLPVSRLTSGRHDFYARFLSLGCDSTDITVYEYSVQGGDAGVQDWTPRDASSHVVTVYISDLLLD